VFYLAQEHPERKDYIMEEPGRAGGGLAGFIFAQVLSAALNGSTAKDIEFNVRCVRRVQIRQQSLERSSSRNAFV